MPRQAKLICTIGPATARRVPELVAAGMDVARINFSHGTTASRVAAAQAVREASAAAGRPVPVLADLAGPKVRLGTFAAGAVALIAGRSFELYPTGAADGTARGATVTYPRLAADIRIGDRVLLADGAAELRVTAIGTSVTTEVVSGGTVRSRQGVSIPSARMSGPLLTVKDRRDLPLVRRLGADYLAQSFIRSADDVVALRRALGPDGPPIVAKIETRPAIDDFDAILDVVDAVMIARGDMGVELPYEEVPIVQKQLVRRALDRGIPSIVATQMLESMLAAPRPTRAEASDVANAVFDGADAIMLSGETAVGAFPILAAEAAVRIMRLCEERGTEHLAPGAARPGGAGDAAALAFAAVALARADPDVAAIACYTRSGRTARILSALRPGVPIYAFAPDPAVVSRLALVHGVSPRMCVPGESATRLGLMAWLLSESRDLPPGAPVVLVASTAAPGSGPNLLELHRLPA